MLIPFEKSLPSIHPETFVADSAQVIGQVSIAQYGSVWFNSVIRGDIASISIGRYSNIQDGCVMHVADHDPCKVGDYVTVGHNAVLHGCTVEDHCLIGMGAIVLNGAIIGTGSIVAAGCVVSERKVIPPHSMVMGVPGKVVRSLTQQEVEQLDHFALHYKILWTERYGILTGAAVE